MAKTIPTKRRSRTESDDWAHKVHMSAVADTLKVSFPDSVPAHTDTIKTVPIERINERELHSIYALLAYVSYNQNVRQETVQMIVEAQFGVDHVAKLRRDDYMRAIEFLVDLKMDEIMN